LGTVWEEEELVSVNTSESTFTRFPGVLSICSSDWQPVFPECRKYGKQKLVKMYLLQKLVVMSFLFSGTGVWTQGFKFARQVLHYLSHTSSSFCSG
jgi:hypothetical protein